MRTTRSTTLAAALGAAALALVLAACGSDSPETTSGSDTSSAGSEAADSAADEAASVSMTDPWVKAAESGMTAAFGTLVNDGTGDVVVTAATSDVTGTMELHETVEKDGGGMAMQPKEGGFTIPAGGEHELAPGGDHLMMMDLERALEPGEVVTVTLSLEDGSTVDVDATVKNFTGADEEYQDGDGMDDMDGDDMGSDENQ